MKRDQKTFLKSKITRIAVPWIIGVLLLTPVGSETFIIARLNRVRNFVEASVWRKGDAAMEMRTAPYRASG
jgi:hypothetical protein